MALQRPYISMTSPFQLDLGWLIHNLSYLLGWIVTKAFILHIFLMLMAL